MKVKQIKPDEVIEKLRNGAKIGCVAFSNESKFCDVRIYALQNLIFKDDILSLIQEEENIFFEQLKE